MKQIKKLTALLMAAALLVLTPVNAMAAAKKEYVPTKAVYLQYMSEKWEPVYEEIFSYTKNGRLRAYTHNSLISPDSATYKMTWKGSYLIREESPYSISTYKYSHKKLKSYIDVSKSINNTSAMSVTWKKRKGTITTSSGRPGSITVNKKNQMTRMTQVVDDYGAVSVTTLKYFSNGNYKSLAHTDPHTSYVIKYNKKGYPISYESKISGEKISFKYKKNKKGQITEQLMTTTLPGGLTFENKRVYSGWKKLSRPVRSCDAFGLPVMTPYSPD